MDAALFCSVERTRGGGPNAAPGRIKCEGEVAFVSAILCYPRFMSHKNPEYMNSSIHIIILV